MSRQNHGNSHLPNLWNTQHELMHSRISSGCVVLCLAAQFCLTLCNLHELPHARLPCPLQSPGFVQTHVHWMSDTIQPSHPLSFPSLLPWILPNIRVFSNESVLCIRWPNIRASASAPVLPMNIQDWFPLGWTGWISLQSKGLSRVFSNITVWKHQFFGTQSSLWSNFHICTWLLEKPQLWLYGPLLAK